MMLTSAERFSLQRLLERLEAEANAVDHRGDSCMARSSDCQREALHLIPLVLRILREAGDEKPPVAATTGGQPQPTAMVSQ